MCVLPYTAQINLVFLASVPDKDSLFEMALLSEAAFNKSIGTLTTYIKNISCSILETEERLNKNINASETRVVEHIDSKFNELNEKVDCLEERVTTLEAESAAKTSIINALEMKSSIHNLVIFNLKEEECDELPLLEILLKLFNETMKMTIFPKHIDLLYRIGKPQLNKMRPVIISFFSLKVKNDILKAKPLLKNTLINICEDCPKEINTRRKQLLPALMGAKRMNKRAFFKIDQLIVDGKVCGPEEIEKFTKHYEETKKRHRSNDSEPSETPSASMKKLKPATASIAGFLTPTRTDKRTKTSTKPPKP